MGIKKKATDDVQAIAAAFKATTSPTRDQMRKYMARVQDAAAEWLGKFDAQEAAALADFAATKQTQYDNYVATLADPVIDPVDPTT